VNRLASIDWFRTCQVGPRAAGDGKLGYWTTAVDYCRTDDGTSTISRFGTTFTPARAGLSWVGLF
jgi:hypothetical protein